MVETLRMYQVDAFTDQLFRGNPAAVLILERWLSEDLMQKIALENNLSETAFACLNEDAWDLRWFTPIHEVDFCGHATLATAHVLAKLLGHDGPYLFHTRIGSLTVFVEDEKYCLDLPLIEPVKMEALPFELDGVFNSKPAHAFRNFENIFVEFDDERHVFEFEPDLSRIARLGTTGLVITAKGKDYDFVSRYFVPGAGIPEDPVTGSIHATLVPHWAGKLRRDKLVAYQASQRGGVLECRLKNDRVHLYGRAVTFMEAVINTTA